MYIENNTRASSSLLCRSLCYIHIPRTHAHMARAAWRIHKGGHIRTDIAELRTRKGFSASQWTIFLSSNGSSFLWDLDRSQKAGFAFRIGIGLSWSQLNYITRCSSPPKNCKWRRVFCSFRLRGSNLTANVLPVGDRQRPRHRPCSLSPRHGIGFISYIHFSSDDSSLPVSIPANATRIFPRDIILCSNRWINHGRHAGLLTILLHRLLRQWDVISSRST